MESNFEMSQTLNTSYHLAMDFFSVSKFTIRPNSEFNSVFIWIAELVFLFVVGAKKVKIHFHNMISNPFVEVATGK